MMSIPVHCAVVMFSVLMARTALAHPDYGQKLVPIKPHLDQLQPGQAQLVPLEVIKRRQTPSYNGSTTRGIRSVVDVDERTGRKLGTEGANVSKVRGPRSAQGRAYSQPLGGGVANSYADGGVANSYAGGGVANSYADGPCPTIPSQSDFLRSLAEITASMSPSELQQFSAAYVAAQAQGVSKVGACIFASEAVFSQAILGSVGLNLGTSFEAMARAFVTAETVATSQGMDKDEATRFAAKLVNTQAVYGAQSVTTLASFARAYSEALIIGKAQGLSKEQTIGFAGVIPRIVADFGTQSEAVLTTFAQSYLTAWNVGVGQGISTGLVVFFARIILLIEARLGTFTEPTLTTYAQQFLSSIATSEGQGQSSVQTVLAAQTLNLATAGVTIINVPTAPAVPSGHGKVKEDGGHSHGHGGLLDIAVGAGGLLEGLLGGLLGGRARKDFDQAEAGGTYLDTLHHGADTQTSAQSENGIDGLVSDVEAMTSVAPRALELQLFTTAVAAGRAHGLNSVDATLFSNKLVRVQLTLRLVPLQLRTTLTASAQAFVLAKTIGTARGMREEDASQFASGMVPVQALYGVQSPSSLATYAQSYTAAKVVGSQQGMSQTESVVFAQIILRNQADFGSQVQTEAAVQFFAQSHRTNWAVGVGHGMTQNQVIQFATIMLRIEARIGAQSVPTVISYAQQFVADVTAAMARCQSDAESIVFAGDRSVARAGKSVGLLGPALRAWALTFLVNNVS